jgi:chorismate mutase
VSDAVVDSLRGRIAELDEQLLATVNARLETVAELVRHKRETGLPLVDPGREEWLLQHLEQANRGPLSAGAVERLCRFVLDLTKEEVFVA